MRERGFTLIELILVVGIFGLVMSMCYQILNTTLEADRRIHKTTLSGKIGEAIISQIRRDLQGAVWRGLGIEVFRGSDRGRDDTAEDSIDFLTTAPVPHPPDSFDNWTGEVAAVGYRLARGDDGNNILFRRVQWNLTEDPLDAGSFYPVYDKVQGLEIRYLDELGEWLDDWDAAELLPEENESYFPFIDEEESLAAEAEEQDEEITDAGDVPIDPLTGEMLTEELPPLPLPRAVEVVLYLRLGDERGVLLDPNGEPIVERVSTIVPLLCSDLLLVEDPAEAMLEALLDDR
ncbi:MAG TPA: prepilin-type N-terminal cleavage/methylation domain-containing protein [Planctomycetes bacterium]|nr:prepilin-type N-terminal cleavage/methylation domain-containing protein [Planctomycetota bacterium]HIN80812.1 prepilin-type N-terminal cleavage/methylation domain-containing protein [Planctomycetota bacterium]